MPAMSHKIAGRAAIQVILVLLLLHSKIQLSNRRLFCDSQDLGSCNWFRLFRLFSLIVDSFTASQLGISPLAPCQGTELHLNSPRAALNSSKSTRQKWPLFAPMTLFPNQVLAPAERLSELTDYTTIRAASARVGMVAPFCARAGDQAGSGPPMLSGQSIIPPSKDVLPGISWSESSELTLDRCPRPVSLQGT